MYICYIDEAGCTGYLPSATSDIQPVLVICGLVINQANIQALTRDFIDLKKRFFPRLLPTNALNLDWMCKEIKGADLRKSVINPREKRHAVGVLDNIIRLLQKYNCHLIGRVWVKGIGLPFDGNAVYTSSIQYIHKWFNAWLASVDSTGIVICDHRDPGKNAKVSHSIFTQKYKSFGDEYPRILEMPVFGHSENHAGIQLGDILCSSFLFPMAVHAYCTGRVTSVHVRGGYDQITDRYAAHLEALQHRVQDPDASFYRLIGGVTVDDKIGTLPRHHMFRVRMPTQRPTSGLPASSAAP